MLTAKRAALPPPKAAATVPILAAVPPELAAEYETPGTVLRKLSPSAEELARVSCVFGVRWKEYGTLLRRMREAGMLVVGESRPAVVNGLFGVAKGPDKDRLIVDAR